MPPTRSAGQLQVKATKGHIMARSILVTYGTRNGSTREVAEAVARTLAELELEVTTAPAAAAGDLSAFDGIVVGGSLYMGRLHPDAMGLLRRQRRLLERTPFAVFALGPKTAAEHDLAGARRQLEHNLAKVDGLEPRAVVVFGGVVDPAKLRFPFSRLPASDARDWAAIDAWAREVGMLLAEPVAVA